jgi:hypothetical protein
MSGLMLVVASCSLTYVVATLVSERRMKKMREIAYLEGIDFATAKSASADTLNLATEALETGESMGCCGGGCHNEIPDGSGSDVYAIYSTVLPTEEGQPSRKKAKTKKKTKKKSRK